MSSRWTIRHDSRLTLEYFMPQSLKIDFVSDIACPWCVIGLRGLQVALERVADVVQAEIVFQPFELNPNMPAEGQNMAEHVAEKFGSSLEESQAARTMIQARAAAVGFDFNVSETSRMYNTFDAHRLLYWANATGLQQPLKLALFKANFTDCNNLGDPDVLVAAAVAAGLDATEARDILATGRYAEEVRAAEQLWVARGIRSVPSIVINDKWLVTGGQPADAFEQALRNIAASQSEPVA
jgi:predicted DsbA family dithiol-disulfide isomerase